ncbi:hypothetical protein MD588_09240 [Photobacterium sp. SDRW27]|uniref:hypothetical protein n=1 Tax=Photobacterium obscurum TaxID=2829490 RepID=UPI002243E677|nr:hypothetical protein [Photobacterium obscurum]MCW8328990.1 hypothetical protein [Photobacterium obscurum]
MHNKLDNLQYSPQSPIRCQACGDYYNYLFLQSATVAFCSNINTSKLDELIDTLSFPADGESLFYFGCRQDG